MTIRFDKAWENAYSLGREISLTGVDVVLVRDLIGRLALVIDDTVTSPTTANIEERLRTAAGSFTAARPVFWASEMFSADSILNSEDLLVQPESEPAAGRFSILERTVVGSDWVRTSPDVNQKRITLYGFKGGVGRSTATFMLAKHLAQKGHCVLVADLDLESPGISELLQEPENRAEHGIVDFLVESAVNNESGLDLVSKSEVIRPDGHGEVWLIAADGRPTSSYGLSRYTSDTPTRRDYLAKLNRIYADSPGGTEGPTTPAARLERALLTAEEQVTARSREPDIILLDSRAGIHDIAAIAITRLSGLSLLFATDSRPTWDGYKKMFDQWRSISSSLRDDLRQRLKMVAAMVPGDREEYLDSFRDNSQQCFSETLYDEICPNDIEGFNFGIDDEDAPHNPIPILFTTDLLSLNHLRNKAWHEHPFVESAYKEFLEKSYTLIVEENS